jgi:plastocyanin
MRRSFLAFFVTIGLFSTVFAPATHATGVAGQITLPSGTARGAVVYLEGGASSTPLAHAVVDQRDKMFLPHISVVTRGTTVRFPNDDTLFHNVFAYFQAKKFDLGMYPRGATKSVTFDKTGLVVLLCNVHSDMSAYIMVVDTPYYAVADGAGRFNLPNVPPGTYTLHAWHESGAQLTRPLTVGAQSAPLALALARK